MPSCITTWRGTRRGTSSARDGWTGSASRRPEVRVVTYYGKDNPIDGVILDVLLRKHKTIKSDLGVAVAVPGSSEQVAEALFQGALFREKTRGGSPQLRLDFIDELDLGPKKQALHAEWESARERERATRSRFAQHTLSPEAVAAELASVRDAIGRSEDVAVFLDTVLKAANVPLTAQGKSVKVSLSPEVPRALRQAIGRDDSFCGPVRAADRRGRAVPRPYQPDRRGARGLGAGPGARPGRRAIRGRWPRAAGSSRRRRSRLARRCWWRGSGITCRSAGRVARRCCARRSCRSPARERRMRPRG